MRIYTYVTSVWVPLSINILLSVLIFIHVRNSTRRVQPQTISTIENGNNNQQPKISRREMLLLRQMIFMFSMFIGGWTPVYLILIITQYIYLDPLIFRYSVVFGELAVLAIIINLFLYNHELKEYLITKVRQCIRCL
jgi:hypothetical protein